ncbi:hypothetical protein F5B20DRAFT_563530 [Whalleya microplaca]|nr:hypothetical protein F5B20DRAFT_563530 [Whalleya microplaca]
MYRGTFRSTFSSAKCTNKLDYPDQQYVAMARCEGDDLDIWSGCYKHPKWVAIQKEPDCACNASKPLIRNPNGKSTLDEIGSLPPTPGGTISFNPTALPTLGTTSSRSVTSVPETSTATPTPDEGTSQGLSAGAKVGIGVGVGVGIPLILALALLAFIMRRKRYGNPAVPISEPQQETPKHDPQVSAQAMQERSFSPETKYTITPPPPEPSPAWSGFKPELAADPAHKSELSGDEPKSLLTSSWNSGTVGSHQVSELSDNNAHPCAEDFH